jgi:hypothetical protein
MSDAMSDLPRRGSWSSACRIREPRALAHTPLGPWLLVIVALGLLTFGVYSWCEARWRAV